MDFCIVLFFLLFFLIPRTPEFSSDFNTSLVSYDPFIVQQTYSVYNPNPYELTVSNIKTKLVTQALVAADGEQVLYPVVGFGAFPPGVTSCVIKSTAWNDMTINYNFTSTLNTPAAVIANREQCCQSGSTFETTGSFDMSTVIHNYDGVSLGTLITACLESCIGITCP